MLAAATAVVMALPTMAQDLPEVRRLEMTDPVYLPEAGIKMGIAGMFERSVAGTDRMAKVYVPEDTRLGAYMVVLNVPQGLQTVQWLSDSGWLETADREKFLLYVLEPGESGEWGSVDDERAYIEAAYSTISNGAPEGRGIYYLPPESYYVVGYGAPGSVLHELAMKDPTVVAAAAFVDASDLEASALEGMSSNFFATPDWNKEQVASSDLPLPVLLMSSEEGAPKAVVQYWQAANQTEAEAEPFEGGEIFRQEDDTLEFFVADGSSTAVAVVNGTNASADWKGTTETIYEGFLSNYTRYGGAAGGNTLGSRPDLDELGVQYKSFEVDGRLREYLVYVPESAKDAEIAGEDVPVVFSLHGAGMTMYSMFDYSRWWEIADREGFILVHPTGLNTANATSWDVESDSSDMTFIGQLVDTIKQDYNVDESRIYLGGQSMGSLMSGAIGRNLDIAPNFAAIGSTSAGGSSTDYAGNLLPYYLIFGEFDFWPWQLTSEPAETEFLERFSSSKALEYWINRNDAVSSVTEPDSETTQGRYHTYEWTNEAGLPVARYTVTLGRGHSIIADEMNLLWDWYDQWQQDENGKVVPRAE